MISDEVDGQDLDAPDGFSVGLAESNEDLRRDLVGLREDMRAYHRSQLVAVQALEDEIETQRILSRFNRRTWFEVMAYLTLGTVLLADLARGHAHSGWWGLLFWTTQHGAGGPWEWAARAVGLFWEAGLVSCLSWRAQVPVELQSRVAHGAPPLVRPERSL